LSNDEHDFQLSFLATNPTAVILFREPVGFENKDGLQGTRGKMDIACYDISLVL